MRMFPDKKCPFDREPCRDDCALFVEWETGGIAFGYCGLLGPFLNSDHKGWDLPITGQHIYPSFYENNRIVDTAGAASTASGTEPPDQA